jgi:hypothetical protein
MERHGARKAERFPLQNMGNLHDSGEGENGSKAACVLSLRVLFETMVEGYKRATKATVFVSTTTCDFGTAVL